MKKIILIGVGILAVVAVMRLEADTHAFKVSYITGAPLIQVLQRNSSVADNVDDEVDMRAGESVNG